MSVPWNDRKSFNYEKVSGEESVDDDLRQKYERQFSNLKEQLYKDMRSLMVTETLNPAFMNGITGVGMAMMLLNMD